MKHLTLKLACVALLLVAVAGQVNAAPKYPISFILAEKMTLLNTKVVTSGVVMDSKALIAKPGFPYKGEFVLQDPIKGDRILVRTKKNPPPNQVELKRLAGTVTLGPDNTAVLIQAKQLPTLYLALGVLVVLALVLAAVVFKPAGGGATVATGAPGLPCPHCGRENDAFASVCGFCGQAVAEVLPPPPPPPPPGMICSCGVENPLGSTFCSGCGSALGAAAAPPPVGGADRRRLQPPGDEQRHRTHPRR